jgi:hypothetical protein
MGLKLKILITMIARLQIKKSITLNYVRDFFIIMKRGDYTICGMAHYSVIGLFKG